MTAAQSSNRTAFTVVTAVFFMWGFITVLNDVLVPHLKALFQLDYARVADVQTWFFGAYFIMSLPSGKLVSLLGYRRSIVIGLCVAGLGALLFYPAAALQSFSVFLIGLFVLASGITLLQVAANPYVSLLGPERTASSRLNLSQAFNSLGTTLAPMFGGLLILSGTISGAADRAKLDPNALQAYNLQQAQAVQGPYLGIAATLFLLALVVHLFRLPELAGREAAAIPQPRHPIRETLKHPQLLFGIVAVFLYVGAEVSIGSFMINYITSADIGNMSATRAANFVALYWGGAMIGRFLGSALLQRYDVRKLLAGSSAVAALLVLTTLLSKGQIALWSMVAIGLFNSIMFSNIFTLGIEKMGSHTGRASSLLVMAIVGGAVIPKLEGELADHIGLHYAYVLPLLCYLYILFYGLKGSKRVLAAV